MDTEHGEDRRREGPPLENRRRIIGEIDVKPQCSGKERREDGQPKQRDVCPRGAVVCALLWAGD